MIDKKTKVIVVTVICIIVLIFALLLWRGHIIRGLPENDKHIPSIAASEKLEIPQRPGIQGIVITGPIIEPLLFSIDSRVSPKELDWEKLKNINPKADVLIKAKIENGKITKLKIHDIGSKKAGELVVEAIETWCYTPYKDGEIKFWFNLATEKEKFKIDPMSLEKAKEYEKYPIKDGKLYHIKGMKNKAIIANIIFASS